MNKTSLITIVGVIAVLLLSWLFFWRDNPNVSVPKEDSGVVEDSGVLITAKHEYKEGVHTIAGEVGLPTPCHILATDYIMKSGPREVVLTFESSTKADACAQVITPARFKIDFKATEDAAISALWNGKKAELNLIPVGEGETLDEFEMFIKG